MTATPSRSSARKCEAEKEETEKEPGTDLQDCQQEPSWKNSVGRCSSKASDLAQVTRCDGGIAVLWVSGT
ncbi:hypothetical protein KQX54_013643 [Cotesia glomerata]|uniref:Uncharacterized protein n=1 Tax=Cotesia glomerata TaxID=32391 RepID=A0AAV7ISE5_COTGL|nr:hypothetical protein KQX54_013643 [Cotesia glomerata]